MEMMTALSNSDIKKLAPSVFAKEPWEGVSKRYAFIPTIDVVEAMRANGMVPVRASQSAVRVAGKRDFTKHMLRFRFKDDLGKTAPRVVNGNAHYFFPKGTEPQFMEVVMTNAHDLSALYSLEAGIYRQVCSNGLVVRSSALGSIAIRHVGKGTVDAVLAATREIADNTPKIIKQIVAWGKIELTDAQRKTFAMAALIGRYGVDEKHNMLAPVTPDALLLHRRPEDARKDLWTTMNIVQENMMRGDLVGASATGRKVHTRAVKSVNTELEVNRQLWALTETMAEGL